MCHDATNGDDNGILLTDFAAACPSLLHARICAVLRVAKVPEFVVRFLEVLYSGGVVAIRGPHGKDGCMDSGQTLQMRPVSFQPPLGESRVTVAAIGQVYD